MIIGGPSNTKGTQWDWNKGKGKGKGKYGAKGKGVNEMEYAYEDQPEEENAGQIQALGGGIQIYSIEKDFPKPRFPKQTSQQAKGKAKGKGKFKPKQMQHLHTFHQRREIKPPGLPAESRFYRAGNERNQYYSKTLEELCGESLDIAAQMENKCHWGNER